MNAQVTVELSEATDLAGGSRDVESATLLGSSNHDRGKSDWQRGLPSAWRPPGKEVQQLRVLLAVLTAVAITGWALAAGFAFRPGYAPLAPAIAASTPGFLSVETGCRYSTPEVVTLISDLKRFYKEIFVGNGQFTSTSASLSDFVETFSDYEEGIHSTNRTFAEELYKRLAAAIADQKTTTLEKFQLGYSLEDVAVFVNLTRIDLLHTFQGAPSMNAWLYDIPLLTSATARALLALKADRDPSFQPRIERWLQNYAKKADRIIDYWARMALLNKTHPYVNMEEWYRVAYKPALAFNFERLCTYEGAAGPCHSAAVGARAANALLGVFLETVYLPACQLARPNDKPGLVHVPDGPEAYTITLQYNLGLAMPWKDIHELGLQRVKDTRQAIEELTGLPFIKAAEMLADVENSTLYFCTGPNGTYPTRQDVVAYYAAIHQTLVEFISSEVTLFPRGQTFYTVAKDTGTYWNQGAFNHTRNRWDSSSYFNIGLEGHCKAGGEVFEKFSALSTLAHEAFPGHGLQLPLQMEIGCTLSEYTPGAPNSFVEGWALYTESLPFHLGVSEDTPLGLYTDPLNRLGYLNLDMLRDNRLVEDTGVHALGWSYEASVEYMRSNGFGKDYAAEETRRYIANPGQAVSYMIGRLAIQDMRTRVEAALGKNFRPGEFHAVLTKFGGSTFDNLRGLVDTYILVRQGRATSADSKNLFGYDAISSLNSGCSPALGVPPTS